MKSPTKLFIRIGNQEEICIGVAKTIGDVPLLLEMVATMLRAGLAPDDLEIIDQLIG